MAGISPDIWIVYGLILLAIVLFTNKRISFDVTSLIIMAILIVSGILSPAEGLSGFSNPATITIACMFILSEGLRNTGALDIVGDYFLHLSRLNYLLALLIIMGGIGLISAFINNTAAVAIFIPVIISLSKDLNVSPSKLLMPLSFAAMFGGVCTLIGTSTNLLVNSIAEENGLNPFTMFDFTPVGIFFFAAGFIYLFTIGIRLIPERRSDEDLTESFEMQEFLTDVVLHDDSEFAGTALSETKLVRNLDLDIIEVFDKNSNAKGDRALTEIESGDILRIRGSISEINKLLNREDISIQIKEPYQDTDFEKANTQLVEAVIAPESSMAGKKLNALDLYTKYEAMLLAVRQKGKLQQDRFADIRLKSGTSLLLYANKERVNDIEASGDFVLASEIDLPEFKKSKIPVALGIITAVVALAAFNLLPIVVSAVCGVVAMILSGCISSENAYNSINWKVIFLLAGILPLGIAMQKTGAAQLFAESAIYSLEELGPRFILGAFFFISMMLTNIISNQATAALLAPIAIETANTLGLNAEPLLMAVTYAASLSFMTPIGYQTNTMIFGPGQYTFGDFLKVGTPLNLIFLLTGIWIIPYFWPL